MVSVEARACEHVIHLRKRCSATQWQPDGPCQPCIKVHGWLMPLRSYKSILLVSRKLIIERRSEKRPSQTIRTMEVHRVLASNVTMLEHTSTPDVGSCAIVEHHLAMPHWRVKVLTVFWTVLLQNLSGYPNANAKSQHLHIYIVLFLLRLWCICCNITWSSASISKKVMSVMMPKTSRRGLDCHHGTET